MIKSTSCVAVFTQYNSVTDRRTHRQADGQNCYNVVFAVAIALRYKMNLREQKSHCGNRQLIGVTLCEVLKQAMTSPVKTRSIADAAKPTRRI